jgi:hypothetical protein
MIKCGHCKERHASVTDVRNCATGRDAIDTLVALIRAKGSSESSRTVTRADFAEMTTENVANLITFFRTQPNYVAPVEPVVAEENAEERDLAIRESHESSCQCLVCCPMVARPPAATVEPGMYRRNGEIFRVQVSRESGRTYAKLLNAETNKFEYAGGAIHRLTAGDRMTVEEAREYGRATGVCCVCARERSNPKSIEAGIGPICGGRI